MSKSPEWGVIILSNSPGLPGGHWGFTLTGAMVIMSLPVSFDAQGDRHIDGYIHNLAVYSAEHNKAHIIQRHNYI